MDIVKIPQHLPLHPKYRYLIAVMLAETAAKLAALLLLTLSPLGSMMAAEVAEPPEEIVVTGRLPGPPLWKVSNGDKVLWIFPYLDWIPKDMMWETGRVARVIAETQEVLNLPEATWTAPSSVLLNPINLARTFRRGQRHVLNPGGSTLEENLPPALYARFAALQAHYFPDNDGLLEMRPLIAGRTMMNIIRKREGLVPGDDTLKTIRRLARRNRNVERTEISVKVAMGDGFRDWAHRMDAVWGSFPPEQERACFEQQVRHMEEDLDKIKSRANTWALGHIDEFRDVGEFHNVSSWAFDELNACAELFRGSSSPEHEALAGMAARVNQMWLIAAENALATNASTFAILPINELLADDGLLNRLKAMGYEISEP